MLHTLVFLFTLSGDAPMGEAIVDPVALAALDDALAARAAALTLRAPTPPTRPLPKGKPPGLDVREAHVVAAGVASGLMCLCSPVAGVPGAIAGLAAAGLLSGAAGGATDDGFEGGAGVATGIGGALGAVSGIAVGGLVGLTAGYGASIATKERGLGVLVLGGGVGVLAGAVVGGGGGAWLGFKAVTE